MDILLKGINEYNYGGKLAKVIKAVNGSNEKLAKKIQKKQGYKTSEIKVQEQYEAQYLKLYEKITKDLYAGLTRALGLKIMKASDDYLPFKIKGKVFYSPETGIPLTNKEWRSIKDAIAKFLGYNTETLQTRLATEQQSLGAILQRMESQGVRIADITKSQIDGKVYQKPRDYKAEYKWSQEQLYGLDNNIERLGNNITGINDTLRKKIITTLNDGISNKMSKSEISSNLLFTMEGMNRDWERMVGYESQSNLQYGYLNTELKFNPTPEEPIYMQAISQGDACKYCKALLNGKVYILTEDAGKIGKPTKDKYAEGYTVLGATNIGNKPMSYIATIPLHPYCRCRWVRSYPKEFAELEKDISKK